MTVRYYYLRDQKNIHQKVDRKTRQPLGTYTRGNPIAVIITQVDKDNKLVSYALASVHKTDKFVKTRGRAIVHGRLQVSPIAVKLETDDIKGHEITKLVMSDIAASDPMLDKVPKRVAEAAQRWLDNAALPRENHR